MPSLALLRKASQGGHRIHRPRKAKNIIAVHRPGARVHSPRELNSPPSARPAKLCANQTHGSAIRDCPHFPGNYLIIPTIPNLLDKALNTTFIGNGNAIDLHPQNLLPSQSLMRILDVDTPFTVRVFIDDIKA